ncbi:MAG: primosomal protein N' [Clostridiales bacterium]|jgi:primosomal protein N' (replication factor Y)|nr:primosomal protein N' [Clostridiales bacterium]
MIAEVIVDITNGEVDRIFDYLVPSGMEFLKPGYRVLVPFGKRDIEGYVIGLKERSELDAGKIKPIVKALDETPVILPEMMRLSDFMRAKYNLRRADTLRLFLPSEMRKNRVKELKQYYVTLAPDYIGKDPAQYLKKTAQSQYDAAVYVRDSGGAYLNELNRNFSAAAVRQLRAKNIFLAEETAVLRTPYKHLPGGGAREVALTAAQSFAAETVKGGGFKTFLLHGVTGSGKTEVYLNCISETLEKGKTAIMLVPEISLTPQMFRAFRARFGEGAAILHSGLSAGERFDEWRRLLTGRARAAIGARSAIFAPLQNLGVVVIDEEHDSSYISENNPRYFTHEVAAFRAKENNCPLVLGSATPSVASYYRAKTGEYALLRLPERINKKPMPEMLCVDMRKEMRAGNPGIFSGAFLRELDACMNGGRQAMVFINRRGHSSFVMCRACGYTAKCAACDVSLVYHSEDEILKCHYCDATYHMLSACPECGSPHIRLGNVGTQRAETELRKLYPGVGILRMDNDTTRTKDAHLEILERFSRGEARILVGTQMIAKGHDFPAVTLVGILDADLSLHFTDYKAAERTFQLVTQSAGRAGRQDYAGRVVLQTYAPHHYVYTYARNNNYGDFFKKELNIRETTGFPPFTTIVRAVYSGSDEGEIGKCFSPALAEIEAFARERKDAFLFLRGMRCPVKMIKGDFRFQILMRVRGAETEQIIQNVYAVTGRYKSRGVAAFVELNPPNLH